MLKQPLQEKVYPEKFLSFYFRLVYRKRFNRIYKWTAWKKYFFTRLKK